MSFRSSCAVVGAFLGLLVGGCQSAPSGPCAGCASPGTQAIVDAVAKDHPELLRLTVHGKPEGCDQYCAIASTLPEKVCKPSDPEDLQAMANGKVVVLQEAGGADVTVPVMKKGARWESAVGVTFKPNAELGNEQFVALATAIAKVVEDRMVALKLQK